MLDLKAQLAAAGIVTAEQVKAFDEKEAKAKAAKEAKAMERRAAKNKPPARGHAKSGRSNHKQGKPNQGKPNQGRGRGQGGPKRTSADALKAMGRGEAYDRIRKIVGHSRLDDKERTIPLPDDQTFNFVTATGSIGRLYLTAATVDSLRNGTSAISSFMSNHGLSHCVLPKEVALELAEVFPTWLRHLRGHDPIVEVPKPPEEMKADEGKADDAKADEGKADDAKADETLLAERVVADDAGRV